MKIVLLELPVWWFRASCLIVGGCILLLLSVVSGNRWVLSRREFFPLCAVAIFNVCCWHVFSAYGVSMIPAGRASIIAFTMPLWAAIFSNRILGEEMDRSKVIGLILGMLGLGVLIGPDLIVFQQVPLGALCMIAAAIGWALGTVLIKRGDWSTPIATLVAWQLLLSAVPVTLIAAALEPIPYFFSLSSSAIVALIYVYVFPMIFCQWAYFKVVNIFPASVAAIGTLMVPVIGVYSSSLILSERVGWGEFFALTLVCSSLVFVLLIPNFRKD